MRVEQRERLLDEILRLVKKYANQTKLKTYSSSIYEWRRVDEIKLEISIIDTEIEEK